VIRRVDLTDVNWGCDHGDSNPLNQHGWISVNGSFYSLQVDTNNTHVDMELCHHDYGSFFACVYTASATLLNNQDVDLTINARMVDQDQYLTSNNWHGVIPHEGIGHSVNFSVNMIDDHQPDYHNGEAQFNGYATNYAV
jgi:hypothetical protein